MKKLFYFILLLCGIFWGCSYSNNGKREGYSHNSDKATTQDSFLYSNNRLGIKMIKVGGVYQIPCVINGVKMNFIFDTGASNVCISMTEAMFLAKNGYLEKEDYIGRSRSQIADGSVVENMEINLHSIEIEGIIITDVRAIVVKSLDAPLLLGQSALQKLGKIEIDGDSLFIIKKGKRKQIHQKKTKERKQTANIVPLQKPEEHWYDKILAKFGYDGKIEEYIKAAISAYENDLPEVAQSYCDNALDLKESARVYGLKGYYYYKDYKTINDGNKDYEDVIRKAWYNLNKYYELNKDKDDLGLVYGDTLYYDSLVCNYAWACLYYDKMYDRMIELGQELYLRNPNNTDGMNILGLAYTEQGNYKLAEKWAKKILDTHLEDSQAYFRLAYLARKQGRYSEALRYYEKCIEIDNANKTALHNMANIYWDMSLDDAGEICYGEKWDAMRSYAVSLWRKAARLGEPYSKRLLKEKGYEW